MAGGAPPPGTSAEKIFSAKEEVEETRAAIESILKAVVAAVEGMTGVTAIKASLEIPFVKLPVHSTAAPDQALDLRLRHGENAGEVIPRCKPVQHARHYEVEWTLDPNGNDWTAAGVFPITRAMLLSGLPRGKHI